MSGVFHHHHLTFHPPPSPQLLQIIRGLQLQRKEDARQRQRDEWTIAEQHEQLRTTNPFERQSMDSDDGWKGVLAGLEQTITTHAETIATHEQTIAEHKEAHVSRTEEHRAALDSHTDRAVEQHEGALVSASSARAELKLVQAELAEAHRDTAERIAVAANRIAEERVAVANAALAAAVAAESESSRVAAQLTATMDIVREELEQTRSLLAAEEEQGRTFRHETRLSTNETTETVDMERADRESKDAEFDRLRSSEAHLAQELEVSVKRARVRYSTLVVVCGYDL